jgi:hypothetical protein
MIDEMHFGWVDDQEAVFAALATMPRPILADENLAIRDTGKGKIALLYKAVEQLNGGVFPINKQTIGDCVSHGAAKAAEILMATDILLRAEAEEWKGLVATEPIYAGSRVEVGGGRISGDGSVGAWGAKWMSDWGVLVRAMYGAIDLSTYDGNRARSWGRSGCPNDLEPLAKEHPIRTASLCKSYEEARDAIANGYPVSVASNRGFTSQRDSAGFLSPSGSWAHQMCFGGLDDAYSRPGLLCVNSWGPTWVSGPKRHDQPDGTFWVDADVADKMLAAGDSYAYSGFVGFPSRKLDYLLI